MVKEIEILAGRGYKLSSTGGFSKDIYKKKNFLGLSFNVYDGYIFVAFGEYEDDEPGICALMQRNDRSLNTTMTLKTYKKNGNWEKNFRDMLDDVERG